MSEHGPIKGARNDALTPESDTSCAWLDALCDAYAPIRAMILRRGISEEEVNANIDAAIEEVRDEQRAQRG